ncbi:PREDICTED: uncharacterized protein LOC105363708 [Ceratosolen solmsi marchali]|uniref:Uncharacterized protein LOC105363708 n=1 Tax=Ceratosolen solmsi marchali TaxID=326594 RepID=A0AAJ6YKK9_9HYME|nr:PREDICTED: uncharacterized protein LOC105363708 [Ceratosolen solmsi marchali]
MAQVKLMFKQSTVDLSQECLFELKCLIKANNIHHATQCEIYHKRFLAFACDSSDLGLYYLRDSLSLPVIKKIPWFQNSRKKIACLCFDPLGSWLLIASIDGSFYIIPAKTLINEVYPSDQKWTTKDITTYSSLNAQNSFARPSTIIWWRGVSFCGEIGIIGTEQGEIIFVNLETGQQVGSTKIDGCIASFFICQDTELDTVTLLITNNCKEQWYLVLEKPGSNYIYPLSDVSLHQSKVRHFEADNDEAKTFPTTRSRLRGLKQLSVEKLVILKQKLAESRNRNFEPSTANLENSNNCDVGSNDNENSNGKGLFFNQQSEPVKNSTVPIALPNQAYITAQRVDNSKTIYTRYLPSINYLTIHKCKLSSPPCHVHKIPEHCESILLTNRFFYISDTRHRFIYIVSRPLSEIRENDESDLYKESIVARFSFNNSDEVINSIYTVSSTRTDDDCISKNEEDKTYHMAKNINDLKVKIPPVDTCIVVTNLGIYRIVLREHILSLFMDLILRRRAIEDATKLGMIFGLNVQQLIEYAGDIILCNRQFGRAMELYSIAKCFLLKTILKFASLGFTSEFLTYLLSYSTTPASIDLSQQNRINFSDLSVLAFTELALRATSAQSKRIYKDFLNFLSTNTYYDELFVIHTAAQNKMWNILHHLMVYRGLSCQVLEILVKALPAFMLENSNLDLHKNLNGLLMCLSDSSLIQGMLNNPSTARNHICFILANLPTLQIFILQRLITLFDPTNAAIRPLLLRFKARRRAASRSSFSSQCDSLDLSEDLDEVGVLIEEIIDIFLQTLLTLLHKKQLSMKFLAKNVPFTQLPDIEGDRKGKNVSVDFKRRLLSTGFAHTALIRNGNVYTWGNTLQGCLGTGPTMLPSSLPQGIFIFRRLGIEVLSVSCGRCHTLAVTNNGVYAWGGNKFGQLGLGNIYQCPNPELITSLAQEIIVEAIAGVHHSAAVTADGRLFTWGWGVHGQLGHGNTENMRVPSLVEGLLGLPVRHASVGYAHTVVLTADGYVYAFGCNLFGQLGNPSATKCTIPVKVSLLPEKITLISTKYFHNLAVSSTNQLYVWGANPQILKINRRERKIKEQQAKSTVEETLKKDSSTNNEEIIEEQDNIDNGGESNDTLSINDKVTAASNTSEAENISGLHDHMIPGFIDMKFIYGKIIQISTGYCHSALLTKDGRIYTWGRNVDGQLGTGFKRDVEIPTQMCFNAYRVEQSKENSEQANNQTIAPNSDKYNANSETISDVNVDFDASQKDFNYFKQAVKICCGSNFTVAIQPGGNVLSWGNNNLMQLGRTPDKLKQSEDRMNMAFQSSKRTFRNITRFDRLDKVTESMPNQVPNIPSPTISYQSYDVTPLAGSIRPLINIEHNLSDLTLHYALEQFHGLYGSFKILNKCIEVKNYQACAKIELLEHNFVEALTYQFKALKECDLTSLESSSNVNSYAENSSENLKDNNSILQENSKLFEKHVEQNLVDTMIESVEKQKIKMPGSKSLDSFQTIEQELHTFDCQGGSEDLFDDCKYENMSLDMTAQETLQNNNKENRESPLSSLENSISQEDTYNDNSLLTNYNALDFNQSSTANSKRAKGFTLNNQELIMMQQAVNIVDFYLYEIEEDAYVPVYEMSAICVNFWLENKFPIEELEKVFYKYMKKIFYSLGLLLFSDSRKCSKSEKNGKNIRFKNVEKILSTEFCLKVCSLIMEHIEEGKPTIEYIELLSMSMANNYGPPLTGYPGTSENKTPEQMIDGIISTLAAKYYDPRPFIHIKDPEVVSELFTADEDSMIFTCGHQFLMSAYQSEAIPRMEAELLTLRSPLPSTAQFLGSVLSQTNKPETLCPLCLSQVLKDTAKNVTNR